MSSEGRQSSMTSVWDTLNAMKARRKAQETPPTTTTTEATPTQPSLTPRKQAYDLFESHINKVLNSRTQSQLQSTATTITTTTSVPPGTAITDDDANRVISGFLHDCRHRGDVQKMLDDMHTRVVEEEDGVQRELVDVRRAIDKAEGCLSVARHGLRKGTRLANGLVGFQD